MVEERRLVVEGRYDNIPVITNFVGESAAAAGFDEKAIFHCQMAADEACTNVIEHAYGGEGVGDIEITCFIDPGLCHIEIEDNGEPFEPEGIPAPHITDNIEELEPGGIGLHLMRQMMDEVHFEFTPDGNRLTMVKREPVVSEDPQPGVVASQQLEPGIWLAAPMGRLSSTVAPEFEQSLTEILEQQEWPWLIVDFEQVTYISSRGLKALISAWRVTRESGRDIILCALAPGVYEVFDTIGFTDIFVIYSTVDEALAHVHSHREA